MFVFSWDLLINDVWGQGKRWCASQSDDDDDDVDDDDDLDDDDDDDYHNAVPERVFFAR